jgi:hypothetical protein
VAGGAQASCATFAAARDARFVNAVRLTALTASGLLVSVELGAGLGDVESVGEELGFGLGDAGTDVDGCGVALGVQVGDGDEWCVTGPDPEVAAWDGDGDGELADCPAGPGCPPLCGCELWLLVDTAVETSIAT